MKNKKILLCIGLLTLLVITTGCKILFLILFGDINSSLFGDDLLCFY